LITIFDIETRQLFESHHFEYGTFLERDVVAPDGKLMITRSNVSNSGDTIIKDYEIKLGDWKSNNDVINDSAYLEQETYTYTKKHDSFYHFSFNSPYDFLFKKKMSLETRISKVMRHANLIVHPLSWNILHILALQANHKVLRELPDFSRFKVPVLLDHFGKTPLHYLISHNKIDETSMQGMFSYICDYLEDCYSRDICQFQDILKSLTLLICFILEKVESKLKERFLYLCLANSPAPYNLDLPEFGQDLSKVFFSEQLVLNEESKEKIWKDGETQVSFQTNFLKLDYNVHSEDMQEIINLMIKQKSEDFFKIPLISKLVDYLWKQVKFPLLINFLAFSIFMAALSVYLCLNGTNLPFEITLLILSAVFIINEGLQTFHLWGGYFKKIWNSSFWKKNLKNIWNWSVWKKFSKNIWQWSLWKRLWKNIWNWIGLSHLVLTVAFLITRIAGSENHLGRAWISAIIILLGYLRWASYLRIFKPTRNLIQAIGTIAFDMFSFVVIIVTIIVGSSIVFLVFERDKKFGDYLYFTYSILFANLELNSEAELSPSLKVIMVMISVLLYVLLLNMLISIMAKSYENVLEKREKTDCLTRLRMILEAIPYKKIIKRNYQLQRGYLHYCEPFEFKEDTIGQNKLEGLSMRKSSNCSSEQCREFVEAIDERIQRELRKFRKEIKISESGLKKKMKENQKKLERIIDILHSRKLKIRNPDGKGGHGKKK